MRKALYNIEPHVLSDVTLTSQQLLKLKASLQGGVISHFEAALKNKLQTNKQVLSLSSATAGLHIAINMSGVGEKDVVFCSNFSFIASVNPILYANAIPWFVEVEKVNGNMSPDYLREAIQDCLKEGLCPKAIVLTHCYGVPAKMKEIQQIAIEYDLKLIIDAAEALGSKIDNRFCGTFGDYSVISFNTNKLCTTFGGGALVLKNNDEKQKAQYLINQSRNKGSEYIHDSPGYNYRMNDLAALYGLSQLDFLEKELELKSELHQFYLKATRNSNMEILFTDHSNNNISNKWMNCVGFISEEEKERAKDLFERNNIESRGLWFPLNRQKFLQHFNSTGDDISMQLYKNGMCLPSGIGLNLKDKELLIDIINTFNAK